MDDAYAALADIFAKTRKRPEGAFVLGVVVSWPSPKHIRADGDVHDEDDLLVDARLALGDLAVGDTVLMAPIEDRQRYVILCKVSGVSDMPVSNSDIGENPDEGG